MQDPNAIPLLVKVLEVVSQVPMKYNNHYTSVDFSPPLKQKKSVEDLKNSAGLKGKSALFRHKIAFVFGQFQDENSVPILIENLENEMVRNECAKTLGAITTDECMKVLTENLGNGRRVVKERHL